MRSSFTVDTFMLVLNRLRGIKANAVALGIKDVDLHATLDGLFECAYNACRVVAVAAPAPSQSQVGSGGKIHRYSGKGRDVGY